MPAVLFLMFGDDLLNKDPAKRAVIYVMGLFIMTLGVSISVKSNLGVSPVSSIPYTMTCVWGIEMGRATIIFHIALVLLQIAVLRRKFKPINLLQVPVGVMFGAFTTFCNHLMTFLPTPENIQVTVRRITDDKGKDMESCPHPKQQLYIDLGVKLDRYDILRRKED